MSSAEEHAQAYARGYSEGLKYALGVDAYEELARLRAEVERCEQEYQRLYTQRDRDSRWKKRDPAPTYDAEGGHP